MEDITREEASRQGSNYTRINGVKDVDHDPPFPTRYRAHFDRMSDDLIYIEGGFSNNPKDPGKKTKFGITEKTYCAWLKEKSEKGHTLKGWPLNVANITKDHAKAIYHEWYWLVPEICTFWKEIAHHVFFMGVNAGPVRAIKILQDCLRVSRTGEIDDATYDKAWSYMKTPTSAGELILDYVAGCRRFYKSLPTYHDFGKGWERRLEWALRTGNDL